MHAQAHAGEGLGRSQGGKRRQRMGKGLKRGSTDFIKNLFGPVCILRTFLGESSFFHYWAELVPYFELFWLKPVKKTPCRNCHQTTVNN